MSPMNSGKVLFIIKELSNDKFTGPACIPSNSLKLLQTALNKPISLIVFLPFSTGSFPDNLKVANVIPILNKNDPTIAIIIAQFHYSLV